MTDGDQLNSRSYGRDTFREIDCLQWNAQFSKFREIRDIPSISTLLVTFGKIFDFYQ